MGIFICYFLSIIGLIGAIIFGSIAEATPITVFNWASIAKDICIIIIIIPWIVWYISSQFRK